MKNRFPNVHRAGWRQRFVAIARQADPLRRALPAPASDAPPRRPVGGLARTQIRVRFAALRTH